MYNLPLLSKSIMDCFGWKTLTLKITKKKFENLVFGLIDRENLDIYL